MTIKWHVIKSNDDLPKAGKYVLVTKIDRGKRWVDIDTPEPLNYYASGRDPYTDWQNMIGAERAIAWTELPEPYRGAIK